MGEDTLISTACGRRLRCRGMDARGAWAKGFAQLENDGCFIIDEDTREKFAVAAATCGQDTGLDDKGGTAVFEGDILEDAHGHRVAVLHAADSPEFVGVSDFAWSLRRPRPARFAALWLANNVRDMSVVGNIHENPSLMDVPLAGYGGMH